MKPFDLNIDAMLKHLSLANTRRTWRDLVARAEKEQWSYQDFLSTLVAEEIAHRQQTRIQRNAQRSCFPFLKTVDDSNFTFTSVVLACYAFVVAERARFFPSRLEGRWPTTRSRSRPERHFHDSFITASTRDREDDHELATAVPYMPRAARRTPPISKAAALTQ